MDIPEMPLTEARLDATKPSQADLDTACRVLWWLAAHARLFPEEYGEQMGISQMPVDVLVAAANACAGDADALITTYAEQMERHAANARVRQEQEHRTPNHLRGL